MINIKKLRKKIDKIDNTIIRQLADRQIIAKKIGALKAISGKKIHDPLREKNLLLHYKKLSKQYNLQGPFITQLFKHIFKHSKNLQRNINNSLK